MKRNINVDIIWNVLSFGIMGVSGIVINTVIGFKYTAETLGVFNQVMAFFIVASQFSVFGLHYSALKHISHTEDQQERSNIIWSNMLLIVATSFIVATVTYLLRHSIEDIFSSRVAEAIVWSLPGLILFSFNKVGLSVINGLRFMKLFAILQAMRYSLMLLFLILIVLLGIEEVYIPLIISLPEFVLFPFLIIYFACKVGFKGAGQLKNWIHRNIQFGLSAFMSGTIRELNTKVDILMLGALTNDKIVGIYSLAALIAEGILQFPVVIRNNVNPLIAKYYFDGDQEKLVELLQNWKKKTYKIMLAITGLGAAAFPIYVKFIVNKDLYLEAYTPFLILLGGILIAAGYFPINMLLIQCGKPFTHTVYLLSVVTLNIVLNGVLIPILGLNGAALATGLSFLGSALLLKLLSQKHLGVRI